VEADEDIQESKADVAEAEGIEKRRHKREMRKLRPLKPYSTVSKTATDRNWARRHALGASATAKWCTVCLLDKALSDYVVSPRGSFGRVSICKACTNSRVQGRVLIEKQKKANTQVIQPAQDAVAGPEEMQSRGYSQNERPHEITDTSPVEAKEVRPSKAVVDEADGVEKRRHKRRICERGPLKSHSKESQIAHQRNWSCRDALGTSATAKWCTVCLLDKDLSDYTGKKVSGFFGRVSRCKSCINSRSRVATQLIQPAGPEEMQNSGLDQDELAVTEEKVEEEMEGEEEEEEEGEEEEEEEEMWMVQALASLVKEEGQDEAYPIQCPCGNQEQSGYILSCEGCGVWLHG
jgi:hypothetical protein